MAILNLFDLQCLVRMILVPLYVISAHQLHCCNSYILAKNRYILLRKGSHFVFNSDFHLKRT